VGDADAAYYGNLPTGRQRWRPLFSLAGKCALLLQTWPFKLKTSFYPGTSRQVFP
jgi:hypothetical protein